MEKNWQKTKPNTIYRRVSLPLVFKLRDKIYKELVLKFSGLKLEKITYDSFVDVITKLLHKDIRYETVFKSAAYLLGQQANKSDLFELSWRLAGNLHSLKAGHPVLPWTGQVNDEWVPTQIVSARPIRNKRGDLGQLFEFRILAGSPCPNIVTKFWSNRFCRFLCRELGFSAPWGKYPLTDSSELVSMRMLVLMTTSDKTNEPYFDKVSHVSAFKKYNKDILKARRKENPPCPKGFTHACYKCFVGYRDCPAATHADTYKLKYCGNCNSEEYFDPSSTEPHCVNCQHNQSAKRKE